MYFKDGTAKFVYNVLGIHEFATAADTPIPAGTHQVRMEFAYDGGGLAKGGDVTLYYDGKPVGTGRVEHTQPMIFSADETTDIGDETGTTVTPDYTAQTSRFTGKINWVQTRRSAPTTTTTSSTPTNASASPWPASRRRQRPIWSLSFSISRRRVTRSTCEPAKSLVDLGSGRASCRRGVHRCARTFVLRRGVTRLGSLGAAAIAVVAVTTPGATRSSSSDAVDQHLTIAGESEVGSPWTPATLRCDSYCFVRAPAFFDSVAAFGSDGQVHGMLAESIVPNTDFTRWTGIVVRPGDLVHRRHPGRRRRRDHQPAGDRASTGCWATALDDVAKVPDPADPGQVMLDIDKVDNMTLTIHTGAGGDPERPLPWRDFPHLLTGQWGLIASPRWLGRRRRRSRQWRRLPIGSGPFIVDSYEPYGSLEAHRNADYWMTDADGQGVAVPRLDLVPCHRGSADLGGSARRRRHRPVRHDERYWRSPTPKPGRRRGLP